MNPPPPRRLVYLAGPPGAGKSTLMAALTAGCARTPLTAPFAHDQLHPPNTWTDWSRWRAVELGRRRDSFAGTDALSMSVQPKVLAWLAGADPGLILGEGDRLANMAFLTGAASAGYVVDLIVLDAPGTVLDSRCDLRGSTQSPAWRAGRATKVNRLAAYAEAAGVHVVRLDGREPADALVQAARQRVPMLGRLAEPQ